MAALTLHVGEAAFSTTTSGPASVLTAAQLNSWLPTPVSATRTAATTCLVGWTPAASPPSGLTYDVTDGAGNTVATAVSGTSTSITVPASAVTPTVTARRGGWVSTSATAASAPCNGFPAAPTGLTLTPGDTQIVAAWTASAANGGTLASYLATATPSDGTLATRTCTATASATTCTLTGLTNGATYTVSVTATSTVGTGPASSPGTAIPYPTGVLSGASLRLWLDGADSTTLFASSTCSGAAATTAVGCWKDKSSNGNHAVQATTASKPSLSTWSGHAVPTYDGTDDQLTLDGALLPAGAADSTQAVAATLSDPTPAAGYSRPVYSWGDAAGGQSRQLVKDGYDTAVRLDTHSGTALSVTSGAWSTSTGTVVLADFSSGTTARLFTSGAPGVTSTGWYSTTGTAAAIGQKGTGGDVWYGPIQEVIVTSSVLSATERRTVEEYLARKWAGQLTPAAPAAVTLTPGDGQIAVAWTAPAWNGGLAVTGYTVTATPSDSSLSTVSQSCASSPCALTGLTNGATYTVSVSAINSLGAGPAATATAIPYPASIMTSGRLTLWLDGADAATLFAGTSCSGTAATTSVGCWKDKSTSLNNAAQSTAGYRPALATLNGRSVPVFDGVDDYLAAGISTLPVGTASSTTLVAATATTASGYRNLFSWGGAVDGQARAFYLDGSTINVDTYRSGPAAASGAISPGVPFQSWSTFTSTAASISTNGIQPAATASGSVNTGAAMAIMSGAPGTSYWWHGPISEVIVLNTALSATEQRTMDEYLAWKWATTITPRAPTGLAVTSVGDGQASLSWTAPTWNGGAAVSSYALTAIPTDATLSTVTGSCASSPCTLSGLTNGGTYAIAVAAVNSAGPGPSSASVSASPYPATVMTSAAVRLWLDAADISTLFASDTCTGAAASTSVGCWKDKSISGNNVSQGTSGLRPTLTTVKGRSVPLFNGSSQYLSGDAALLPNGTATSAIAIAAAVNPAVAMNGISVIAHGGTGNTTQRRVTSWSAAGVDVLIDPMAFSTAWPGSLAQGVVVGQFTSGTSVSVFSGSDTGTTTAGAYSTGTHHLWVGTGGTSTPSGYWMGNAPEIIVFNAALSTTSRRNVEEYLARKWGGIITPRAPSGVVATAGSGQASVSWTAPSWDGGGVVSSSTVTASPGGATCTGSPAAPSCVVTGLTTGTPYTFTVKTTNSAGASAASTASSPVTPS